MASETLKTGLLTGLLLVIAGFEMFFLLFPDKGLADSPWRAFYYMPVILAAYWFGLKAGLGLSILTTPVYLLPTIRFFWAGQGFTWGNLPESLVLNLAVWGVGRLRNQLWLLSGQMESNRDLAAVGRAASSIAHDMKTPLMAIGGFVSQVSRTLEPESNEFRKLSIALRQTSRLESLVKDILAYARPMELHKREEDLNQLVLDCLELIEELAGRKQVELKLKQSMGIPPVMLDRSRIQQALINLLSNAVEAAPPGGYVQVSSIHRGNEVRVEVADNGEGIMPDKKEEIFLPFVTAKDQGTGLGLSIARKIVEAHQGRLYVRDALEGGAVFVLLLPLGAKRRRKMFGACNDN
ncbi:sensor histidine kinase [Dethiosulfatarculus sandiegensis]|uniref:histidine kinase n=1 Tax=Dethiosulfatarculus sandiegensis TaxID=1429043 RepID=A0A0D2JBH6_9BACT|nr:ATP-binding protein [Dethiosulfatarculus sandiegensis]KIX15469.1 hypothetical protein X474_04235 [Dethiosulfatarculus sandiegensis]